MQLFFFAALFTAALLVGAAVIEHLEKCTIPQEIIQAFYDGSNKPREEAGVPKLIYDCDFEAIAKKTLELSGYAERRGYSSIKFNRKSENDLPALFRRTFEELNGWPDIHATLTNRLSTRFGCTMLTSLMKTVHVVCVYNHEVSQEDAVASTMVPETSTGNNDFHGTTHGHFWDWMTTHYPHNFETTPGFQDVRTTEEYKPHQESTPGHFWDWWTTHYPHHFETTHFWDWMTTHYPHYFETTPEYHNFRTTEEYKPHEESTPGHFWDWMTTHYPHYFETTPSYHNFGTTEGYKPHEASTPGHFWDWMTTHYPHYFETTHFWDWMTTHYPHYFEVTQGHHDFGTTEGYKPHEESTPEHFWDWMTTHYPHFETAPFWNWMTTQYPHNVENTHFWDWITTHYPHYFETTQSHHDFGATEEHKPHQESTPGHFENWMTTHFPNNFWSTPAPQDFETAGPEVHHESTPDHLVNGVTADIHAETPKHDVVHDTTPEHFWNDLTTHYYKKK